MTTKRSKKKSVKAPEQSAKNPAAVALGALGASKGGIARAKKLSPKRRRQIAVNAIKARWAKRKTNPA